MTSEMKDIEKPFDERLRKNGLYIISGPCSAESEQQTLDTARELVGYGVGIFRAGVWKPRTRPGGFEGIGSPALPWLRKVKRETGMLVGTEVANARHLRQVLAAGLDYIWIGARTTANPFAVQEIADELAALPADRRDDIAVFVKNPVNPDIELWIGAIQRIYNSGIRRIAAIHRGFSSYAETIYRNTPLWRIPIELHRRIPELTILCDPSHIAGRRDLIAPLSRQAVEMRFDGLFIESHCTPDNALSDARQQLTPATLGALAASLTERNSHTSGGSMLTQLREQIDGIDNELLQLLARRMAVSRQIGELKKREGMHIVQPDRYNELMQRRAAAAEAAGLDSSFARTILAAIHEESVRQQLP